MRDFETEKLCIAGSCGKLCLGRILRGGSRTMQLLGVDVHIDDVYGTDRALRWICGKYKSSPMLSIAKTRVIHEYVFF